MRLGRRAQEKGTLAVKLHSAVGLPMADMNFKSDPYVLIQFAGEQKKSTTIRKNLNPRWGDPPKGEHLDLGEHTLADVLSHPLVLRVFDEDKKRFVDLSDTNHLNAGMTKIVNVDGTDREVDTLDNVMQGVDNIALIKIDVEGFELEIIQGAQHILGRDLPCAGR